MITDPACLRATHALWALSSRCAADPERPRCHFAPPARWMNDPNGTVLHDGWFHLFYQLNPFKDRWDCMHWGHARSRDLVDWQHLPVALAPDFARGEEHCFSGTILHDGAGRARLAYTSVGFEDGRRHHTVQLGARPLDAELIAWERDPAPCLDPASHGRDARDPCLLRRGDGVWCLLGDRDRVLAYRAEDGALARFSYQGVLFEAGPGELPWCECPSVVPLDAAEKDEVALLVSPMRAVAWRRGRWPLGRAGLATASAGLADLGDHWYATSTCRDHAGRTVLFAWIRGFPEGRGWAGCLAFPRVLEADGAAGVRQRFHPALAALRQGSAEGVDQGPGAAWTWPDAGRQLEVRAHLRGPATLRLGGRELRWDGESLELDGQRHACRRQALDLHLLLDRSVLECLADGGRLACTRTRVAPAEIAGTLVAEGDLRLESWRLRDAESARHPSLPGG
jgi:beta-fructofuranosidase